MVVCLELVVSRGHGGVIVGVAPGVGAKNSNNDGPIGERGSLLGGAAVMTDFGCVGGDGGGSTPAGVMTQWLRGCGSGYGPWW